MASAASSSCSSAAPSTSAAACASSRPDRRGGRRLGNGKWEMGEPIPQAPVVRFPDFPISDFQEPLHPPAPIDPPPHLTYIQAVMSGDSSKIEAVRALAARVDELLLLVQRLADENRSLRVSQESLIGERA